MNDATEIYARRFSAGRRQEMRKVLWGALTELWFPKWIRPTNTVVELGAGYCLFINEITAAKKVAVDINVDTADCASADVEVIISSATNLGNLDDESVDVVFSSNFFEHLATREELLTVLGEIKRVLRPNGLILTLMPNINHVKWRFWDFIDHTLPLNPTSLSEALEISNFKVETSISKFLPYTAEGKDIQIPKPLWRMASHLYIKTPLLWYFLGKQMFVVARKSSVMSAAARSNANKG